VPGPRSGRPFGALVSLAGSAWDLGPGHVVELAELAHFVVEDANSYQKLLELVERLATIGAVREGLASADRGEGRPAEEFSEELGQGRKSRPEA
jgi:hypothetical protein